MGNRVSGRKKDTGPKFKKEMRGTAASGKSTFTRQMRLLFQSAWTQQELDSFYAIICSNIYDGMKEVCSTMKAMKVECDVKENVKRARYYKELGVEAPVMDMKEAERLKALWEDENVKKVVATMSTSCDLHMNNLNYFMGRLDAIAADNYVPNDMDILHSRQRSTGATETIFVKDNTKWTLIDMGGQRPERAKWERAIGDGIKACFFFVSTEEFDVEATEEKGKTKLDIALETWKHLLTSQKLEDMTIFLLLNKVDLLESKLAMSFSSFTKAFPDFSSKDKSKEAVLTYIQKLFMRSVPSGFKTELITCSPCCALDTDLVEKVFSEAKSQVLQRALANAL